MPAIAAVLVLVGAFLTYAGITGQSPSREFLASVRGQPKPPPTPPLLGQQSSAPAGSAVTLAAEPGVGTAAVLLSTAGSPGAVAAAWAQQQIGLPYLSAAADRLGPKGYDCSGLTFKAWEHAGYKIGLDSYAQVGNGTGIPGNAGTWPALVRPGDLLFRTGDTPPRQHGHVTMVVDSATEVEAPHTGDVVKLHPIPWSSIEAVRRIA